MKIFTNDDIRKIERYTIEREGVTSMELIERVAEEVTSEITRRWRASKPVVVFAGPGNNGADGLAVARLLSEQGYRVYVYLFNIGGHRLSVECAACRDMLCECPNVDITEVIDTFNMPELTRNLLIIDAMFGSGLREPLSGGFAYMVGRINEANATVVSIDIPSGLSGEWNPSTISRDVVHATLTIVIQHPRLAFFIPDNAPLVGEWKVIDIGMSDEAARNVAVKYYLLEEADIKRQLRHRDPFCSKRDFGEGIIYGGSYGMMGAAVLAAKGALRSGIGKLTVEAPKCGYPVLQTAVPEALYCHNQGEYRIERIFPQKAYKAVAIGPGLGTNEITVKALEEFLSATNDPVILDADALNCIAQKPTMLNLLPVLSILTPHAGEFDRLFGAHQTDEARLRKACEMARHYNILIVLKGRYTAIVRPDEKIYFNSSGTPALATPGSGDVLAGILTSFVAQGYTPEIAALLAVYIHGLAGKLAAEEHGEYGVTAGDVADRTGRAIRQIMNS